MLPVTTSNTPQGQPDLANYLARGGSVVSSEKQLSAVASLFLGTMPEGSNIGDGLTIVSHGIWYVRSGPDPERLEDLRPEVREKVCPEPEYWKRLDSDIKHRIGKAVTDSFTDNPPDNPVGKRARASVEVLRVLREIEERGPMPVAEILTELSPLRDMHKDWHKKLDEAARLLSSEMSASGGNANPLISAEQLSAGGMLAGVPMGEIRQIAAGVDLGKDGGEAQPPPRIIPTASSLITAERTLAIAGITPADRTALTSLERKKLLAPHNIHTRDPLEGQEFTTGVALIENGALRILDHSLDNLYPAARPQPCSDPHANVYEWVEKNEPKDSLVNLFMGSVFPGADEERRAWQIIGSLHYGRPRQRKLFPIIGTGGTGKSTLVKILAASLGSGCTVIRVEDFNSKFTGNILEGRDCLCLNEYEVPASKSDPGEKKMWTKIKEFLGDGTTRAERKNVDSDTLNIENLQVVLVGNDIPFLGTTANNQRAWTRRLEPLPMDVIFEEEEHITSLAERIIASPEEMVYFVSRALLEYSLIVPDGDGPEVYQRTPASDAMKEEMLVNWEVKAASLFSTGEAGSLTAAQIKTHMVKGLSLAGCPHILTGEEGDSYPAEWLYKKTRALLTAKNRTPGPAITRSAAGGGLEQIVVSEIVIPDAGSLNGETDQMPADEAPF